MVSGAGGRFLSPDGPASMNGKVLVLNLLILPEFRDRAVELDSAFVHNVHTVTQLHRESDILFAQQY